MVEWLRSAGVRGTAPLSDTLRYEIFEGVSRVLKEIFGVLKGCQQSSRVFMD